MHWKPSPERWSAYKRHALLRLQRARNSQISEGDDGSKQRASFRVAVLGSIQAERSPFSEYRQAEVLEQL